MDTILITGGTGKFGRKFVEHFVSKGWQVLFTARDKLRAKKLIRDLPSGDNVDVFVSDLSVNNATSLLIDEVLEAGYRVNHVVNNARSLSFLKTNEMGQTDRSDFLNEYLIDVIVPYEISIGFYNRQKEALRTITNIGSQYGVVAANRHLYEEYPKQSPIQYGVAKAALGHLTKELAVRFAPDGIRVNCIAYGGVEGRVDEKFQERYAKLAPIGRMLKEVEIAGPLDFLTQESSACITGETMIVDGGWSVW